MSVSLEVEQVPMQEQETELAIMPAAEPSDKPALLANFAHQHYSQRSPWLRAFVLGANDGLVVTSSLMLGFAGGGEDLAVMRLAGVASCIAGALSMALGEYISVSSQRDAEEADIEKERQQQQKGAEAAAYELQELTEIYINRGLSHSLARQVAEELTAKDVIRAHARDELGIDLDALSNPFQAGAVSAAAFTLGSAIPLLAGCFLYDHWIRMAVVITAALVGLSLFGSLGAHLGGANMVKGAARVAFGGAVAMGATYGIGMAFGASIA